MLSEDPLCYSIPLLRTTTGVQNPSELEAVVSFRDDYIKWGRIEVSWWGRVLCGQTGRRQLIDLLFEYLQLPVAGQHQFSVTLNRLHLIPVVSATSLIGHLAVEILLDLSHRDLPVTVAVTSLVGSAAECR